MRDCGPYRTLFENVASDPLEGWIPGCPVRVERVRVLYLASAQRSWLQFGVQNLTADPIERLEYSASVKREDGAVGTITGVLEDADVPVIGSRTFGPIELPSSLVTSARVTMTAATRSNGRHWRRTLEKSPNVELRELDLGGTAAAERARQLKKRGISQTGELRFCHQAQDDWWVCACGTPNVDRATCRSCGVSLADLPALEDEAWLESAADERTAKRGSLLRRAMALGALSAAAAAAAALAYLL